MIKYNKYKPSEIEWVGYIPDDWRLKRVKHGVESITGFAFKSNEYSDKGIKLVRGINVKEGVLNWNDTKYWSSITPELKKYFLKEGDILIQMDGSKVGKNFCLIKETDLPLLLVQRVTRLRAKADFDSDFLFFNICSTNFFNWISIVKTDPLVPHITLKNIEDFVIAVPSLEIQQHIARYLNIKTQTIDKKTDLLIRKSSYYKEYRKCLINKFVCEGFGGDLKNSELGFDINSNFNPYRLKDLGYLYSGLSGKSGDDFNQDENENNKGFIPFTNIANNTYLKKDHLGVVVVYENENQNKVQKGDIFFLMSSEGYEDIGKTAILDDDLEETYLNSFCKGYRVTNKKVNPYFLNYLLLSDNYRKQLTIEGKGFTRINLKMEKVNDFKVYLPNSIDEQIKIVEFLDQKTQTIDNIIVNINKQIETLKELRKTLINDVVTGKIKVVDN